MLIPDTKHPEPYLEAGDALPPAYTDTDTTVTNTPASPDVPSTPPPQAVSSSSSTSSTTIPHPRPPPTNYLNIFRENYAIKGTYAIDPSMPPPPSVTPVNDTDGHPLNLRLTTTNGSIDAVVMLVRSPDAKGPAHLEVGSQNGSVTFRVEDERQQRFHLDAASANGAVTLRLPSTFHGPISTQLQNGRLIFSPAVQARLTTFSEDGKNGSFFVGDYAESGFSDQSSWLGDALRVKSQNGRVRVLWSDENEEQRKGFFKRFF